MNHPDPTATQLLELRDRLPSPTGRRAIRERLRLSREAVARELGVSHETVVQWERGATPRGRNLAAYVELLERLGAIPVEGAS